MVTTEPLVVLNKSFWLPLLEEPNMVRAFAKEDELVAHKKLALMMC